MACGARSTPVPADRDASAAPEADADSDVDSDSDPETEPDTDTQVWFECYRDVFDAVSTCEEYCACMQAQCPDVSFPADCMTTCASLAQGEVCDQVGDSLECRHYHCEGARKTGQPEIHCNHAAGQRVCVPSYG